MVSADGALSGFAFAFCQVLFIGYLFAIRKPRLVCGMLCPVFDGRPIFQYDANTTAYL